MDLRDDRGRDICAIVVVACHFENPLKLCKTTIARLETAIAERRRDGRPWRYLFVVTGDVPYEPGGKPLAELMREYLRVNGICDEIIITRGETGSFAEPKLVCAMLKTRKKVYPLLDQLIVVSSDWQHQAGEPFWRECARRAYLQLHLVPVYNTGGWRTRLFYAAYATFIRLALVVKVWDKIEPFLYRKLYAPRYTKGFRANGCA